MPGEQLDAELRAALARYGLEQKVHLIVADSRKVEPPSTTIEVLFIDGDHSYEGAKADFDRWSALRAPGRPRAAPRRRRHRRLRERLSGRRAAVAEIAAEPGWERQADAGSIAHFVRRREPLRGRPELERRRGHARRARARSKAIETICVDNGSTDGSDDAVERAASRSVELLRTGANLGFAGGNNVGIRRALERGADWVLLLNNDAVAEPGLADALERGGGGAARRGRARVQDPVRGRR